MEDRLTRVISASAIDDAAERAYTAMYGALQRPYAPPQFVPWSRLPDVLKVAWRAAAAAARNSDPAK